MKTPQPAEWRIGELAKSAGVTVRTLHHYEAEGLLPPPRRTEGGHRVYDATAVQRIHQIRSLRALGLQLDAIRQLIKGEAAMAQVFAPHLKHIDDECARLLGIQARLRSLLAAPRGLEQLDGVLAVLADMSVIENMAAERSALGMSDEDAWRRLGAGLREQMDVGAAPGSKAVQVLAIEIEALLAAFARGDKGVAQALDKVRQAAPPPELAGWTPDLMDYLGRALAHLRSIDAE